MPNIQLDIHSNFAILETGRIHTPYSRQAVNQYASLFFEKAADFIDNLPDTDKAKVLAAIKMMETDFDTAHTKILKTPIRELIVRRYRIVFFLKGNTMYFVSGFIKKTQKTPMQEIEYAFGVYSKMK